MNSVWTFPVAKLFILTAGCLLLQLADRSWAEDGQPQQPPALQLPAGFETRSFKDDQGTHVYAVYIPETKAPEEGWPVVLFLHGAGEKGHDGILPITVGLGTALEENPQPFIAVFPQCESMQERLLRGWEAGLSDSTRALKILQAVEATEHVNASKRILCGWSMGGYGAWSVAAKFPQMWSAVLAISGGTIGKLDLEELGKSQTPVWAIHGVNDALIMSEESDRLIKILNAHGGNGAVTLIPGIGHDVWTKVFAQPEVFHWMVNPDQVNTQRVDFSEHSLLPQRSPFCVKQLSTRYTIPSSMSLRLGNDALTALAEEVPASISAEALQGELEDIQRTLFTGEDQIQVSLKNLRWSCVLQNCELKAISAGRFRAKLGFQPIELKIGETSLKSAEHAATTNEVAIVIGHQFPAVLELEIQPEMRNGELHFVPLRQKFEIADNNWFIRQPTKVNVMKGNLKTFHVTTGLVGGLYQQRNVLQEQVLGVVPELLKYLALQVRSRPAPQLARIMWPLPVLVPKLELSPARIRTDRNGVSLVMDLNSVTYGNKRPDQIIAIESSFNVREIRPSTDLRAALLLASVEGLSQSVLANQSAQVNVLDLPGAEFEELIKPAMLLQLFPDIKATDRVHAVLQLNGPFQLLQAEDRSASSQLTLNAPQAAVAYFQSGDLGEMTALGSFHFQLTQPVTVQLNSTQSPPVIDLTWNEDASLVDLKLEETKFQENNSTALDQKERLDLFSKQFLKAWTNWSSRQSHAAPVPSLTHGTNRLVLRDLSIENHALNIFFNTQGPQLSRSNRLDKSRQKH